MTELEKKFSALFEEITDEDRKSFFKELFNGDVDDYRLAQVFCAGALYYKLKIEKQWG